MTRTRGYTLLEMMVVVALLALATAMVAPAGYRMVGSWLEAGRVDTVMKALAVLPLRQRDEGRELHVGALDPDAAAGLAPLPEGWQLELGEPLTIGANGACSDSRGTLSTARQTLGFRIEAPFCRVRRLAADEE